MSCRLYQQETFRQAAGAEFRPGGLALTQELAQACALQPGDRVLDLGCGVGSTASFLASRYPVEVTGLDASPAFIEEARDRDEAVEWVLGSASKLPFDEGSFDAVFCECFLSLFCAPGEILGEVRRVLRPGGRLAVSDMYFREPAACRTVRDLPAGTCLSGAHVMDEVLTTVQEAGFEVEMRSDRSEVLKTFLASLIFAYGSAALFWEAATGGEKAAPAWLKAARPGYFTLVGRSL